MNATLQILVKAKERIGTPSRWCRYWSVSEDGHRICAASAVGWAAGCGGRLSRYTPKALIALKALADASGINPLWTDYDRVTHVNGESHRAVMAMYERAIKAAGGS